MENFKRGGILFIGILLAVAAYNYFTQTINLSDLLPKKEKTPEATLFELEKSLISEMVERSDAIKNWKSLLPDRYGKAFTLDIEMFIDTSAEKSFLVWGLLDDVEQYNDSIYMATFDMCTFNVFNQYSTEWALLKLFCPKPKMDTLLSFARDRYFPEFALIVKFTTVRKPQFKITSEVVYQEKIEYEIYTESEIIFDVSPPVIIYGTLTDFIPVQNMRKHVPSYQKSLTNDSIETN